MDQKVLHKPLESIPRELECMQLLRKVKGGCVKYEEIDVNTVFLRFTHVTTDNIN